jgi:hypothetical protein
MQSPEDELFQAHTRSEHISQRATELSSDYEAQLRGAGVDFDSDDAYDARAMLTLLAYRRVNYELRLEELPNGAEPETELPYLQDETRHLQAQLLLSGMGKSWLTLVDEQFPGRTLTDSPEDLRFVADKMAEETERTAQYGEQFERAVDEFHVFLQQYQVGPLLPDELQALLYLATLRTGNEERVSEMHQINLFDKARGFLMRSGVRHTNVWHQLVRKFFADGAGADNR